MIGERCDSCKKRHWIRFLVPDEAWEKIKSCDIPGGGRLCLPCAEARLKEAGYYLAWTGTIDEWSKKYGENKRAVNER